MNGPMAQLRKGTTTLIVLSALRKRELYGYGLCKEVTILSKGLFPIQQGSLYPLLHAMEEDGLIASRRQEVRGRQRRYYRFEPRGRQLLAEFQREWRFLSKFLDRLGCHKT